jgi:rhomboid family GlyGly-CTERM serine protease
VRLPPLSAALALACLLLALAPESLLAKLEFERGAILAGELWRLWTCHLVHFSVRHALFDALALLAAGAVAERHPAYHRLLAVAATAIPAGLLAAAPAMDSYRGASGLAAAAMAAAGAALWRTHRPLVSALALLAAFKVAAETASISAGLPAGVAVAWQAHLLGAVAALGCICFRRA